MIIFPHPNMQNFICPVCKTNDDKPVVLVGIYGTWDDGVMEANQYHLDCLELNEEKNEKGIVIFQVIRNI
jgi:hypothetical protein